MKEKEGSKQVETPKRDLSEDGGLVRACPQFWGAESDESGAPSFRLGRQQQKLQTSVWSVGCAGPTKAVPIAFHSAVAFCFFFRSGFPM